MTKDNQSPFLNGTYYHRFTDDLANSGYGPAQHSNTLLRNYRLAAEMIANNGWENPLNTHVPNVLLLGTASVETSKNFVYYVHKQNPLSQVTIADISDFPLVESAASELGDNPRIEFAQVDARRLSEYFLPNTFGLIETDGFLKFFSDADKLLVLKQMYDALEPGGILTTREGLYALNSDMETRYRYERWKSYVETLGAPIYPTSGKTMWEILGEAGFSRTMATSDRYGFSPFTHHIVARKPLKNY